MVKFVYLDETGSPRGSLTKHRHLQLVAAIVNEEHVRALGESVRGLAEEHLGLFAGQFELHGNELWNGTGRWDGKSPPELLEAYEAAIALLDTHDIDLGYSIIDRQALHDKYVGMYDDNSYRLALQFLLEKIQVNIGGLKIVIADESKEEQLKAMRMVADKQEWGGGAVPGPQIPSIIDSLHYVQSQSSPGVQMADMVAYLFHRSRLTGTERHPDANSARQRMLITINNHIRTYRWIWP